MIPSINIKARLIVSCALIAALITVIGNSSKEDESNFYLVQTGAHLRKPAHPVAPSTDPTNWSVVDMQCQRSNCSSSDDSDENGKFSVTEHANTRASTRSTLFRLISRLLETRDKKNKKTKAKKKGNYKDKSKKTKMLTKKGQKELDKPEKTTNKQEKKGNNGIKVENDEPTKFKKQDKKEKYPEDSYKEQTEKLTKKDKRGHEKDELYDKQTEKLKKKEKKDTSMNKPDEEDLGGQTEKLTKQEKHAIEKNTSKQKIDHRAIRIRTHCDPPLNIFRTCYDRALDPNNDLEYDELQLLTPFKVPYIHQDEWMVTETMYLVITEFEGNSTSDKLKCDSIIQLEELTIKYLMENIGDDETFTPLCVFLGDDDFTGDVTSSGDNIVVQTSTHSYNKSGVVEKVIMTSTAVKVSVVLAFKRQFAKEVDQTFLNATEVQGLEQSGSRFLAKSRWGRSGFGACCSGRAINSKGAPSSASCRGVGGSNRCTRKAPKKNKKERMLFDSGGLPDFFEMGFDYVVKNYASYAAEQTRGIIDAEVIANVAKCAVNRYMEDTIRELMNIPKSWFKCCSYVTFRCSSNEDIIPEDDKIRGRCSDYSCPTNEARDVIVSKRIDAELSRNKTKLQKNQTRDPTTKPTARPTKPFEATYWPTFVPTGSPYPTMSTYTPTVSPTLSPTLPPSKSRSAHTRSPSKYPPKLPLKPATADIPSPSKSPSESSHTPPSADTPNPTKPPSQPPSAGITTLQKSPYESPTTTPSETKTRNPKWRDQTRNPTKSPTVSAIVLPAHEEILLTSSSYPPTIQRHKASEISNIPSIYPIEREATHIPAEISTRNPSLPPMDMGIFI